VPLVLKLPGNALAGTRHSSEVGLADVAPTVLGILGLGNLNGADGRNLWSAGSHRLNELSAPQSALLELDTYDQAALVTDRRKLIVDHHGSERLSISRPIHGRPGISAS